MILDIVGLGNPPLDICLPQICPTPDNLLPHVSSRRDSPRKQTLGMKWHSTSGEPLFSPDKGVTTGRRGFNGVAALPVDRDSTRLEVKRAVLVACAAQWRPFYFK